MLKTVGRYELLEMIGQGGMGAVYKAFDPLLRRTVAVKLISAVLDDRPDTRERFFREARAAGQLSHRNIIVIYDLGEDRGQPFLAMEYLDGASLDVRMSRGGVPVDRAVDLMIDICGALEYAHQRGVVHRDIKPGNLFVTDADEVKVLDFGLAHLVSSELTRSETIVGTANYMAPEQVRGERVDRRADLFAAGAVLYELLTGRKAFDGDSFANTLYQVLEAAPAPVHTYDATIPLPLAAVVERALAKRREDRHQTAAEMARELVLSREALKPAHRYPAMVSSLPTTVGPRASGSISQGFAPGGGSVPDSGRPGIDMPVRPPQPPRSVAWSPRRVRTTAVVGVVGIVLAGAGSALLLGPRGDEPDVPPAEAIATSPAVASATQPAGPEVQAVEPSRPERAAQADPDPPPETTDQEQQPAPPPARRPDPPAPRPAPAPPPRPDPRASAAAAGLANAAIARIGEARTLAEKAGAASLAGTTYRAAIGIEGEARGLNAAGEFGRAAARALDAEAMYRSAAAEARVEAAERARAVEPPPAPVTPEEPPPAPPPPAAPAPQPSDEAPPSREADSAETARSEEMARTRQAIRGIVGRYVAALQDRSIADLKEVWPSLGGAHERALRAEFSNARSLQARLADQQIETSGDRATVTAVRHYELITVDGQRLASQSRMLMRLRRSEGAWVIESVTYQQ